MFPTYLLRQVSSTISPLSRRSGVISLEEAKLWIPWLINKPTGQIVTSDQISPLAIGCSGGSDSTLLTYLLFQLLGKDKVKGLIVDHGFRLESEKEALLTRERMDKLGVSTNLIKLKWESEEGDIKTPYMKETDSEDHYYPGITQPTGSKLETIARKVRYESLGNVMWKNKLKTLALGHHMNDNIETALYRFCRESGIPGLSGMSKNRSFPIELDWMVGLNNNNGLRVVRPMLDVSKQRVYDSLKYYNLEWVEDPTNHQSTGFHQRSVIRNFINTIEPNHKELEVLTYPFMSDMLDRLNSHTNQINLQLNEVLKSSVYLKPELGLAQLHIPTSTKLSWFNNPYLATRVLTRLAQWVTNSTYPPKLSQIIEIYYKMLNSNFNKPKNFKTAQKVLQTSGAIFIAPTKRNPWWTVTREPMSQSLVHKLTKKVDLNENAKDDDVFIPNLGFKTRWDERFFIRVRALKDFRNDLSLLKWARTFLPSVQHLPLSPNHCEIILKPLDQYLINDHQTKFNIYKNQLPTSLRRNIQASLGGLFLLSQGITVQGSRQNIPILVLRIYTDNLNEFTNLPKDFQTDKKYVDVPLGFPSLTFNTLFPELFEINTKQLFGKLLL